MTTLIGQNFNVVTWEMKKKKKSDTKNVFESINSHWIIPGKGWFFVLIGNLGCHTPSYIGI